VLNGRGQGHEGGGGLVKKLWSGKSAVSFLETIKWVEKGGKGPPKRESPRRKETQLRPTLSTKTTVEVCFGIDEKKKERGGDKQGSRPETTE